MPLSIRVDHYFHSDGLVNAAENIIAQLNRIERKVAQLHMDNAQALALLGEVNDSTNQIEASLEDAAGDIDTLIAIAKALPTVSPELANGLATLKANLARVGVRAGAIASAYPPIAVPPDETPGSEPIPGDEPPAEVPA